MKSKLIYLILCCFCFSHTADANFLKKLKKQAQDAVERGILKKTDEVVSEETEKVLDSDSSENEEETEPVRANVNAPLGQPANSAMSGMNPFGSGKAPDHLPDTYAFDWEFKTKIKIEAKKKKDNAEVEMNYFINEVTDYYAVEYESEEFKASGGKATMVFDFKSEAIVILSEYNGQRMAMLTAIKDPSTKEVKEKDRNYTYKEVGTKKILGYECYGMQIENKESLITMYFTLDAPVNFSAFFAFSSKAAPKGFSDPQLFDILKEEALLMEMEMVDKKGNQNMQMTAISLEKNQNSFNKADYQFMNIPSMSF